MGGKKKVSSVNLIPQKIYIIWEHDRGVELDHTFAFTFYFYMDRRLSNKKNEKDVYIG